MSIDPIASVPPHRGADVLSPATSPEPAEQSWQSHVLNAVLSMLPIKRQTASASAVQARARKLARHPPSHQPTGMGGGVQVVLKQGAGWPVYYIAPSGRDDAGNFVLFLHGGGYINEIVRAHWRIVGYLTRAAQVRCVVPIFPLAPRGAAKEIVPGVGELLRQMIEAAGPARVTVVANSAGAGLALAAAQWLRDGGHRQPDGLVLISPGLDASISRPEQVALAASDPMNDIPGTREGARLYAGDLDITHPYVSPLRGDLRGLAPMVVFSGTRDFLYPDSVELAAKARAVGVPVELHLRKGQPHNYVGFPTPEGSQARELIARVVA
jgi:acetyl esterase/lipase